MDEFEPSRTDHPICPRCRRPTAHHCSVLFTSPDGDNYCFSASFRDDISVENVPYSCKVITIARLEKELAEARSELEQLRALNSLLLAARQKGPL
jgi:hypothetical protein